MFLKSSAGKLWAGIMVTLMVGIGAAVAYRVFTSRSTPVVQASEAPSVHQEEPMDDEPPPVVAVTVVHPVKGVMERVTTQPGSVHAFESVQLFAKMPGFLKSQNVDIGARVKKGEVLAVVDVPELEKQVQRNQASLEQARSKVVQMKARVASAQADREAAQAEVKQSEATAKSSAAWVRFRQKQLSRMKELFALKSIDERLVDENQERYEASVETEQAAVAAVSTTKAKVAACVAKILQAEADVAEAQSEVKVAQADLERVQVQVSYATITAPFDGVVTLRSLSPGDFVRAANEGAHAPLLTVQRTDLMRVVVQVPDRDVIYADPGDPATLVIDALPGMKFHAKISRIAQSQDPQTRLMHVEIDLPNPTGKIRDGMYGRATILLDKAKDKYSIPTSCLVSKSAEGGQGNVYVVHDGHAHLVSVRLGENNGLRVEVMGGIGTEDQVVLQPPSSLAEGTAVHPIFWDEAPVKTADSQ